MLDPKYPWGAPVRTPLAAEVEARIALERWQIDAYHRVRRTIFAEEQELFEGSDIDEEDERATPIVAVGQIAGMPDEVVGVVRIYATEPRVWFGGRLGVCRAYRRRGAVGALLIATAVSSAHAWGCQYFFATVQEQNVRYFERHHFRPLKPLTLRDRPHWLMQANLAHFPPCRRALELLARRAA